MLKDGLIIKAAVYSLLALSLTACIAADPKPDDPAYAPVMSNYQHAQVATTSGSLYQAGYRGSLFTDKRAARVGDVLTILLDERTSSSKKSETGIKKENLFKLTVSTKKCGFKIS